MIELNKYSQANYTVGSVVDWGRYVLLNFIITYNKSSVDISIIIACPHRVNPTLDEIQQAITLILGVIRPGFSLGTINIR